ncbi:hypothetical protein DMENIID0001_124090 [Sergentomyia squamirostris]
MCLNPVIVLFSGMCLLNELTKSDTYIDHTKLSFVIIYIGGVYQSMAKYFVSLKNYKKFQEILIFMEDLRESLKERDNLSYIRCQNLEKSLKFSVFFVRTFFTSSVIIGIMLFLYHCYLRNFSSPLMYNIPFLHEESLLYRPTHLVIQFISFLTIVTVGIGLDFVLVIIVGYLDGELMSIASLITELNRSSRTNPEATKFLKRIHSLHVRVLNVLTNLREIYWHLSVHIILSNFIFICLNLYVVRFLVLSAPTVLTFFNGCFQLFILSYISQILLDKTEQVAYSLYQTTWYEMDIKNQKIFLQILQASQIQRGIEAGGLTIISINTFVQVLKSAITYAAFLYTLIN